MSTTYHIDATAEAGAYHGIAPDGAALTAVAVSPQVAAGTAGPRAAFEAALGRIAAGRWWLLELAQGAAGWEVADVLPAERAFAVAPGVLDLPAWLAKRAAAFGEDDFYTVQGDAADGVDAGRARAFDLVGAAAGWPAPIPQRLGLVALLRHEVRDHAVLVLTDAGERPEPGDFVEVMDMDGGQRFDIRHRDGTRWEANALAPYVAPDGLGEDETFFLADGRLREAVDDPALAALIAAAEAEGGAWMWSFPPLLALSSDQPVGIGAGAREAWRKAALAALFDVILAGLVMPVSARLGRAGRRSRVQAQFEGLLRDEIAATDPDRALALAEAAGAAIFGEIRRQVGEAGILAPAAAVFGGEARFAAAFAAVPDTGATMTLAEARDELAERLDPLAVHLASETGAARLVLALVDAAIAALAEQRSVALAALDIAPLARARMALEALLTERFDTMAALRADAGSEVCRGLLAAEPPSVASAEALLGIDWMAQIFAAPGAPPLPPEAGPLGAFWLAPRSLPPALAALLPPWQAPVPGRRRDAPSEAFRPDPSPQPLPLRLMPSLDPALAERVARRIRGLGALVAVDGGEATHASLLRLEEIAPAVVRPDLPAASNGAMELFVPYAGLPLASPNLAGSRHDAGNADAGDSPAYRLGEADYAELDLPLVPPLAYGRAYGLRGFWVANSGALPKGVRGADPFTPAAPAEGFRPAADTPYLRRTAVSPTSLIEPAGPPRLGRVPPDVAPLALDAPRMGLGGLGAGAWRRLDLWRLADGTGALTAADKGKELRFPGFERDGVADAALRLCLCTAEGEQGDLEMNPADGALTATLPDPLPDGAWLRLSLTNTAGRVQFDPPELAGVARPVDPPPLLLLAPGGAGFREGFGPARFTVQAPGVAFADLDAFASNPAMLARMTGDPASPLLRVLRRARAVFEAIGEGATVDLLDRLPDPAVSKLVVTLDPLDRLNPAAAAPGWGAVAPLPVPLAPYRGLGALLGSADQVTSDGISAADPAARGAQLDRFRAVIREIHRRAGVGIEVSASGAGTAPVLNGTGPVTVTLPAGQTAALHIAPLVPDDLLAGAAILQPGLKALAQASHDGGLLFGGAALTLEAMAPAAAGTVAPAPFAVAPEGTARAYRLVCRPDAALRPYAGVDLDTQRWRPTGLPIHDWVAPAAPDQAGPIAPVARGAAVLRFEAEAFAGRRPDDGEGLRLRIPTAARGGRTAEVELRREDGPARAAGWLRHRLRLRSRYAGALAAVPEVTLAGRVGDWDFSVAILADPGGALTRPQLRAILPLPHRIPGRPDATPPLLAVLDEPPMAQLGLAERILAEIRTTRSFGFPGGALAVTGLRKEVGPDPRLTYAATGAEDSRRVTLQVEGPFGLTFDQPGTPAPRFASSQVLLRLDAGRAPVMEESFVAVSLIRIAAEGWFWPAAPVPEAPVAVALRGEGPVLSDDAGSLVVVSGEAVLLRAEALLGAPKPLVSAEGETVQPPPPPPPPPSLALCPAQPEARLVVEPGDGDSRRILVIQADRAVASARLTPRGAIRVAGKQARQPLSPPTFVEWVRTARDVTRLMVNDAVLPVEDPRLTLVRARGQVGFRLDGEPAMVRSPSMAGPVPLGLHRHLAILATRPSEAVGRARQLFAEARLADFLGSAQLATDAPGLRLMEFEVPARALLSLNGSDLPHLAAYKRPRFDLAATRPVGGGWPAGLRLSIRVVTRALAAGEAVTLRLTGDAGGQATLGFRPGVPTRGLVVQQAGTAWQVWAQSVAGLVPVANATAPLAGDGFTLTLGTDAADEIWCDVSVLHSAQGLAEAYPPVDFDWFFGPVGSEPPETATAPAALLSLPEAQARILGVSGALRIAT